LAENSRKTFSHEGIEISVAFPGLKIIPPQKSKRNDHLQKPLLVMNFVINAVEGCDSFEKHSG